MSGVTYIVSGQHKFNDFVISIDVDDLENESSEEGEVSQLLEDLSVRNDASGTQSK